MVVVRPGNRIFGRRWEQILVLDVGRAKAVVGLVQGHLDTLGLAAAYSVPDTRRHCQSISWTHLGQFTHMPIFYDEVLVSLHTHTRACLDINTMRGVSNQSCVHVRLVSPRTFRYLCREQWTRSGPHPVKPHQYPVPCTQ